MDLQVYLIIVTVFFASLGSLLLINKQLRGGKTFEEALAEKRQLVDKMYGTSKKKNAGKKANNGKKNQKGNKNSQDNKAAKATPQPSAVESEGKSDSGSEYDANGSNASPASNDQHKVHVEFTEEEIISPDSNTVQFKRQLSAGKLPQHPFVRKTSTTKSPGSGILVNKPTNASKPAPPANGSVESLNHFDVIQPKDDLEIKKHRDESLGRTSKKDNKKGGAKQNKKDGSPAMAKAAEKVANAEKPSNDGVDAQLPTPIEAVAASVVAPPKESPKNTANKEKPNNKKKRNDALLVQQLVDAGVASSTTDVVNVNAIMQQLGRTELTRNEIQILIDFLLNKQQDTASVTHSDWSDDVVHKLRKQIEEKDRLLAEEQKASYAIHAKLREIRAELNADRAQLQQLKNLHADEKNSLKAELNQAQQDHQLFVERANAEKQALNSQLQHLQQKLFQEKNTQSQENAQKLQQLTDANAQFAAELATKNSLIQDLQEKFLQIRDEHLQQIAEYERKFQEYTSQSEADIGHLNAEIQRLRSELQRKEEYEKMYAMQKYENEQLEARLADQSKTNNQMDDSSKVEIRNLQNALDSTKTELTQSRTELADGAKRISDLTTQLSELKSSQEAENLTVVQKYNNQINELNNTIESYQATVSEKDAKLSELQTKLESASADQREQELFKQIADYKEKNNELRKKNWKLVDALQKAEESAYKISSKCKLVTSNVGLPSVSPSKKSAVSITTAAPVPSSNDSSSSSTSNSNEHILRTKQVLERLFPNVPSTSVDYDEWLTNLASHIEETQQKKQQNCVQTQKPATASSNNHQNGGDDEDVDDDEGEAPGVDNITGNGTHHQGNGTKSTANTEELILQNAQLKSTVDEYKSIVAETEGVLTTLEKKVKEQDAYWRSVVQLKENEIRSLQQNAISTT